MEFIIGKDGNSLKKLTQIKNIKLIILAGQAKPTPPVGPALGQYGVNLMDFCKQFNDLTKTLKTTIPISTEIRINPDKTFKISLKAPSNTYFLKIAANQLATSAASQVTGNPLGPTAVSHRTVTLKQIYEIAIIRVIFSLVLTPQGSKLAAILFDSQNQTSLSPNLATPGQNFTTHFYKPLKQTEALPQNGIPTPFFKPTVVVNTESTALSGMFKNICKNIIGSAQSLKYKIVSDL